MLEASDCTASTLGLREAYRDPRQVDDRLVQEYVQPAQRPEFLEVLTALSREYFSEAFDRMTEAYDRIIPPLLLVWGDGDPWLPVAFGTQLIARAPRARLQIVPGAGHLPHQERPEIFNQLLLSFLGDDADSVD